MPRYTDFPEFEMTEDLEESLMNMLRALGWDGDSEVDPTRIKINKEHWMELCDQFLKLEGQKGGMMFMNYGPSTSEDVPFGKVKFEKGW